MPSEASQKRYRHAAQEPDRTATEGICTCRAPADSLEGLGWAVMKPGAKSAGDRVSRPLGRRTWKQPCGDALKTEGAING